MSGNKSGDKNEENQAYSTSYDISDKAYCQTYCFRGVLSAVYIQQGIYSRVSDRQRICRIPHNSPACAVGDIYGDDDNPPLSPQAFYNGS
jgi:hypothetical protein